MEDSNSLASFQIAGLHIQNAFRFLFNALKSYYKRRVLRSYSIWRYKCLYIPKSKQREIKNSMIVLQLKLSKLHKFFQNRVKLTFEDVLRQVLHAAKVLEFENNYFKEEEALKHTHQQEIQNLTKELKSLTFQQEELEKTAKNMKIAEDKYKTQINELSEKKNEMMKTRKKNKKAKESEIVERIEELKEENEEIKEKIDLIENNVTNFINEMGGLLEHSEEIEKTNEKRKISLKKTGKVGKKGRAPLFTIDIGKN